jgi:hypothetical protein
MWEIGKKSIVSTCNLDFVTPDTKPSNVCFFQIWKISPINKGCWMKKIDKVNVYKSIFDIPDLDTLTPNSINRKKTIQDIILPNMKNING